MIGLLSRTILKKKLQSVHAVHGTNAEPGCLVIFSGNLVITKNIEVLVADYKNTKHGSDMSYLLDCYSRDLMGKIEEIARSKDCCKITLKILEGNEVAQNAYKKFGFSGYELDPVMGRALFWQKVI